MLQQITSIAVASYIALQAFFAPVIQYGEHVIGVVKKQAVVARSVFDRQKNLGATDANIVPTTVALFESSLTSGISSSADSFSLTSGLDKDGNALASSTYAFIIDEGTSDEEFVIADCTGSSTSTACVGAKRGVSALTGTSTVSALQKAHRRGASVKITDAPALLIVTRILKGEGNIPAKLRYNSSFTFTNSNELISKGYADALVNQGAATATESNGGISELSTRTEGASGTPSTAAKPLVLQAQHGTSTITNFAPQSGSGNTYIVWSRDNGTIDPNFIATSSDSAYRFGGVTTFVNSTTTQATTTQLAVTSPFLRFNGVTLQTPSTQGASSTSWVNDGSGVLTNSLADWQLLREVTATSSVTSISVQGFSAGSGFAGRAELKVVINSVGFSSTDTARLRFNGDTGANYGYLLTPSFCVNCISTIGNTASSLGLQTVNTQGPEPMHCDLSIMNRLATRKIISGQCITASSTATLAPNIIQIGGVWNNTAAQITSIELLADGATTIAAGSRISVYGKRE